MMEMRRYETNNFSEEQRKKIAFPVVPLWKSCFFASSSSPTFSCNMKLPTEERYNISAYLQSGKSGSEIADFVGVHRSTISRELRRNRDKRNGIYKPDLAQDKHMSRMRSQKHFVMFTNNLKFQVDILIKKDFSPEQVTGFMRAKGLETVSHETIYQYIWEEKKHGDKLLYKYLRRRGRRHKKRESLTNGRGFI